MPHKNQRWYHTLLSWILYHLGDFISKVARSIELWCDRRGIDFLDRPQDLAWAIYQKVMGWSVDLDPAGKVWDYVGEENADH